MHTHQPTLTCALTLIHTRAPSPPPPHTHTHPHTYTEREMKEELVYVYIWNAGTIPSALAHTHACMNIHTSPCAEKHKGGLSLCSETERSEQELCASARKY